MGLQMVELHYSDEPNCDYSAILDRAEDLLGENLDSSDPKMAENAFLIFHKQHPTHLKDGKIAPQTVLLRGNRPIKIDDYSNEIQQSWGFRESMSVLLTSRHTLLVTEMMARGLPTRDRVRLFHGVFQAVIEVSKPIALVFKHSQQVVQPQTYLARVEEEPILRPGSINVRFFNISNTSGDMLMDTRGLTEIGLHDLQCHYRGLDPNAVSNILFNTALYIFENGPVIESGNTVAGIEEGSKWKCQFEEALVQPARSVLDLNPGAPYAAGGRR